MKKRMSRYLALPLAAGLAVVLVAITSWGMGPTAHAQTATPIATNTAVPPTATPNPDCVLKVSKDDNVSSVAEGGTITYTITIDNNGDNNTGECSNLDVTDVIPDDTDCTDASVDSSSDISSSHFDINGCDSSGTVEWTTDSNLGTGDQVVLTMVVDLTSGANDGDHITNEACADADNASSDDCDSIRTLVGAGATATPQPTATTQPPVVIPTVIVPAPLVPTARALPTLAPPITGTGPESNSQALAIGLGLIGVCLLLVSGAVVVKRTR